MCSASGLKEGQSEQVSKEALLIFFFGHHFSSNLDGLNGTPHKTFFVCLVMWGKARSLMIGVDQRDRRVEFGMRLGC